MVLLAKEIEGLEHHSDLGAQAGKLLAFLGELCPSMRILARINAFKPVDGAAHRRFSRAGRPHHDQHLALVHADVDVLEHMELAKMLLDMGKLYKWTAGLPRLRTLLRSRSRYCCCGF
jgi:hypothetical protein